MATAEAFPGSTGITDCQSVQMDFYRGRAWATAPCRKYARVWNAILSATDDDPTTFPMVWMPAHTAKHDVGSLRRSDGAFLTSADRYMNAVADRLAKEGAALHRVAEETRNRLKKEFAEVCEMATWIAR
eukprot:7066624-Karenia_brevis.AAC.1